MDDESTNSSEACHACKDVYRKMNNEYRALKMKNEQICMDLFDMVCIDGRSLELEQAMMLRQLVLCCAACGICGDGIGRKTFETVQYQKVTASLKVRSASLF